LHSLIQFAIRSSDTPLIKVANSAESSFTSSSTQVTPSSSNFLAVAAPKPDRVVNFVVSVVPKSFFAGLGSFLTLSFFRGGAFLITLDFFVVFCDLTGTFFALSSFGLKVVLFFSLNS
jgi:hypothetical protein